MNVTFSVTLISEHGAPQIKKI